MAGIAIRAGARSTLSTLWLVNDEATASLMSEFYKQLVYRQVGKAEAIQRAQLKLLNNPKYKHPYYWAPYVLIGNWL
jgi:CHAT domain-containing protein